MFHYIKYCLIIILSFLFWCGIYDNIMTTTYNKCEMTYMYEYPQYKEVKIDVNHSSNYKLFVYGEGYYFNELTKENFKGIPVLFIPGNQGSFKQVRSLASVAYRKSLEKYKFHFNYFTIDFKEEIGALFGPVLEQQTHFVGLAIKAIIKLYKNSSWKPHSVVLVGHSIGGLVARAVVGLEKVAPDMVSLIITLATPHSRPVIIPDKSLRSFYDKVNDSWAKKRDSSMKNIAFVSIGGGRNDIQVPSTLTTSVFADLDATLLSVPSCWLTTDHLAIVWCKQLVLAVTRALFDSVDKSTSLIIPNRQQLIESFKNHISEKTVDFQSYDILEKQIQKIIKKKENWIEVLRLQHVEQLGKNVRRKVVAIPLTFDPQRQHLTIVYKGSLSTSVLIVCKARVFNDVLTISSGENLYRNIRIIPGNKKEVNLDVSFFEGKEFTHVVAFAESKDPQTSVEIDFSDVTSRTVSTEVPTLVSSFSPLVLMESTPPNAVALNVTLHGFTEVWQFFTLFLKPLVSCPTEDPPIVSVQSSWTNRWEFLPSINAYEFHLKVDIPSPEPGEGFLKVHIVKSSSCVYSVSLQKNLRGMFERISLLYAAQLPAFSACHLLLLLSSQYKTIFRDKTHFFSSIFGLSPITVIPFVNLGAFAFAKATNIETDRSYLEKHRINIDAMPLGIFLCAMPLTLLVVSSLKILVTTLSQGIYFCRTRISSKRPEEILENSSPRILSLSSVGVVFLISVGAATCGALPLSIAAIVYVLKVVRMKIDVLQCTRLSRQSNLKDALRARLISRESSVEFHFTLTLLVLFTAALNLPTLITWAKNFKSQEPLASDPSFFASFVVLCSLAVLWQRDVLNPSKKYYMCVGYIIHVSSILVILFGTIYLFRVNEIVACILPVIALHQFSPY